MDNNIYITFYALGWLSFLFFFLIKNREIGIGGIILIVYSISSISSIYFYNNGFGFEGERFSCFSFLYLFVCTTICVFPLVRYSKKLSKTKILIEDKSNFIYIFLLLCTPIILEGFLEISYIAFKTSSIRLGSIYESDEDAIGRQLTFIGRKTLAIIGWFQYLWPILFFYCIAIGKKYKKFSIIALLAFGAILLNGYAGASRVAIVRSVFYFVIVYVFFKSSLKEKTVRVINILISVSISFIVLLLALITISRFTDMSSDKIDIFTWITLYTGEGELRFAQHLWNLSEITNGDTCFSFFKQLVGFDTFTDYDLRRVFYERKLGIPTHIFYTFIGDWFLDFGIYFTPVFCVVFSLIQNKIICNILKTKIMKIGDLVFLCIISCILVFGITYYVFKTYTIQLYTLPTILWVVIINIINKTHAKR